MHKQIKEEAWLWVLVFFLTINQMLLKKHRSEKGFCSFPIVLIFPETSSFFYMLQKTSTEIHHVLYFPRSVCADVLTRSDVIATCYSQIIAYNVVS